ncbi:MAG: ABC transporter permease [Eggerthellaceae bacterium]|nr:ABC transporter permease [Eggerthellaceae bacterium]
MLAKLAFANVRRSYKDFAIYFFTLLIGVAVFYAFNSITAQDAVLAFDTSQGNMIELLSYLINGVSVFICVILTFLVVYASRYLIKRRNKEFAIYLLLGMPKGTLLRLTLVETLIVGLVSLVAGIGLGLLISQGLLYVTAFMFVVDIPGFTFFVAQDELVKTVVVFLIIFALALFFNVGYVMKAKLIDLIQSERKNDTLKLRSIPLSFCLFLVSCVVIGVSYYLLSENGIVVNPTFGAATALVCVGTLLFFYSLSGFLLRVIQSIKPLYYRGLNMFTLRQVASRINSSFVSMAVICMTLFLAITSVAGGVGISLSMQNSMASITHYDASVTSYYSVASSLEGSDYSNEVKQRYEAVQSYLEDHDYNMAQGIADDAKKLGLPDFNSVIRESAQVDMYDSEATFGQLDEQLGKPMTDYVGEEMINPDYIDQTLSIVPVSQYNHAMEISGRQGISLGRDEAVLNCDTDVVMDYARDVAKSGITLNVFGHDLAVDRDLNTETFQTTSIPGQMGILIVSDEIIPDGAVPVTSILNVQFTNNPDAEKQWKDIYEGISTSEDPETWPLNMGMTKEEVFSQNIGLTTIIAYLAIYIGLVLVVACAAILAIQQLTSASDNRTRYQLLNKLGAPRSMVNGALFKQILIAFLFPLILAIAHSLCALQEVVTLVQLFGHLDIGQTSVVVSGAFLAVYGLYFVLTYVAARGVIRSDR